MNQQLRQNLRTSLWLSLALSCIAMLALTALSERHEADALAPECAGMGDGLASGAAPEGSSLATPAPAGRPAPSVKRKVGVILRNLLSRKGRLNPRAARALRALGPKATPYLLDLLRVRGGAGPDPRAVIAALGELGDPAAVPPLLERLARPGDPLKGRVCEVVAEIATEADAPRILELTHSPAPDVRAAAFRALAPTQTPAALEAAMEAAVEDSEVEVRLAALELLSRSDGEAVADVRLGALEDPDRAVRLQAVRSIGRSPVPGGREALKAVFARDPDIEVRRAAAEALARL